MAALFEFYAPDVEWDMTRSQVPDTGVYRGHDGIRSFFREFQAPFDGYWAHAEEFMDLGDRVAVRVRQGGRGKGSGVEIEMPKYWQIYTLRDGRAVRVQIVRTAEDALGSPPPE
jgi:ketosteroid isomerase-like protein